jgi:C1A family cysteine protease
MKFIVFAACAGVAAGTLAESGYEFLFTKWAKEHNKEYETKDFFQRYHIFRENLDFVMAENSQNRSYELAMNQFGDLTWDEFKAQRMGYRRDLNSEARSLNEFPFMDKIVGDEVAAAIDWRDKGIVTPVKDQGSCGSCWAFSATGSLEGAYAQAKGRLLSFSEQQLVDCSGPQGNNGCGGGLMDRAFNYWKINGACLEADYAYTARNGVCKTGCLGYAKVAKYTDVAHSETSLLDAVNIGPISVAIEPDQQGFQFYKSGVFQGPCGTSLDHGVLVVGYGDDAGMPYWLVKNSWGPRWGEAGYIRIGRNRNLCGIANEPSYPVTV